MISHKRKKEKIKSWVYRALRFVIPIPYQESFGFIFWSHRVSEGKEKWVKAYMLKCIAVQVLSGSVLLTDSGVLRYTHASTLTFLLTLIVYIFLMKNTYIGYDLIRYMLYSHKNKV